MLTNMFNDCDFDFPINGKVKAPKYVSPFNVSVLLYYIIYVTYIIQ